jgi:hypothetical protein
MVNCRLFEDVGTRERVSSQCTHHGIVRSASLAVKHFTLASFPDNDDRSLGGEKTALNTFVERAPSSTTATRHRREFALLKATVANLESPQAVAAAPLLAAGPDDRPRRKSKR